MGVEILLLHHPGLIQGKTQKLRHELPHPPPQLGAQVAAHGIERIVQIKDPNVDIVKIWGGCCLHMTKLGVSALKGKPYQHSCQ